MDSSSDSEKTNADPSEIIPTAKQSFYSEESTFHEDDAPSSSDTVIVSETASDLTTGVSESSSTTRSHEISMLNKSENKSDIETVPESNASTSFEGEEMADSLVNSDTYKSDNPGMDVMKPLDDLVDTSSIDQISSMLESKDCDECTNENKVGDEDITYKSKECDECTDENKVGDDDITYKSKECDECTDENKVGDEDITNKSLDDCFKCHCGNNSPNNRINDGSHICKNSIKQENNIPNMDQVIPNMDQPILNMDDSTPSMVSRTGDLLNRATPVEHVIISSDGDSDHSSVIELLSSDDDVEEVLVQGNTNNYFSQQNKTTAFNSNNTLYNHFSVNTFAIPVVGQSVGVDFTDYDSREYTVGMSNDNMSQFQDYSTDVYNHKDLLSDNACHKHKHFLSDNGNHIRHLKEKFKGSASKNPIDLDDYQPLELPHNQNNENLTNDTNPCSDENIRILIELLDEQSKSSEDLNTSESNSESEEEKNTTEKEKSGEFENIDILIDIIDKGSDILSVSTEEGSFDGPVPSISSTIPVKTPCVETSSSKCDNMDKKEVLVDINKVINNKPSSEKCAPDRTSISIEGNSDNISNSEDVNSDINKIDTCIIQRDVIGPQAYPPENIIESNIVTATNSDKEEANIVTATNSDKEEANIVTATNSDKEEANIVTATNSDKEEANLVNKKDDTEMNNTESLIKHKMKKKKRKKKKRDGFVQYINTLYESKCPAKKSCTTDDIHERGENHDLSTGDDVCLKDSDREVANVDFNAITAEVECLNTSSLPSVQLHGNPDPTFAEAKVCDDVIENMEVGETCAKSLTTTPEYESLEQPRQVGVSYQEFKSKQENHLRGCLWSPDGSSILTNSDDNILRLFQIPDDLVDNDVTDELYAQLKMREGETVYDMDWYPYMESQNPDTCCFLSTSRDHPIHLWDACTGVVRCSYRAFNQMDELTSAHCVSFNVDGSKVYCGFDKCIRIFESARPGNECVEICTVAKKNQSRKGKHKSSQSQCGIISSIAFSGYGGMYALGSFAKTVGLYDTHDGTVSCVLDGHTGGVTQVRFTTDGYYLISGARKDNEIIWWDLRNTSLPLFKLLREVSTNQRIQFDIDKANLHVFSGSSSSMINIWDLKRLPDEINEEVLSYEPTFQFSAHDDAVNAVCLHPTKPLLASTSGQRHFFNDSDSDTTETDRSNAVNIFDNSLKIWKL